MIENLKCCLAHPMTALRTLKNKLNEVITGHNELVEKVDNLPAGGGDSSAGAGVKYVRMVLGERQAFDMPPVANTLFPIVSFDSSYDELYEAYQNGVYPVLYVDLSDDGANAINLLPLGAVNLDEGMESLMFSAYISGVTFIVSVNKNSEHAVYANIPEF